MKDVVIIGAGTAGLSAGLYCARYKLDVVIIGSVVGGTGLEAHKVDNWIGDPSITGMDLMDKFVKHVKGYKVPVISSLAKKVSRKGKGFLVETESKKISCKALILCTGMKHRKLGIPGEDLLLGKGVSYCYTCDSPFFKDKVVGVVGGSDSAATGALMLSKYASKVYVLYRGSRLRAEPVTSEAVYANKKIKVMHKVNVKRINGSSKVESVLLDNGNTLDLDGVFIEIGHMPMDALPKMLKVELDSHGFIKVSKEKETSVKGVFAAGDITNTTALKQFITSAGEGSVAAFGVYNYLRRLKNR